MKRPVCGHCGAQYGHRRTETIDVYWNTPLVEAASIRTDLGGSTTAYMWMTDGPVNPPPPYVGNFKVIKEGQPHVSQSRRQMTMTRTLWDGETWSGGYAPFCTLRCALHYARWAWRKAHT